VGKNNNPTGKGGFKKGISGNPLGPAVGKERRITVQALARKHTPEVIAAFFEIVTDKKEKTSDRIAAGRELLDRGWHKPLQPSDVRQQILNIRSLEDLDRIEAQVAALEEQRMLEAPIIEAEAVEVEPPK
jgi:hypothetical protein